MLSIGKLTAGQARYYLDHAEDRVDVVQSVGDGAEEYYFGESEARGEWIGSAAVELGLDGRVDATELRRVLAGLDPRDGSPLRSAASRVRVGGFDLTFSAPKSVSVLFGVGDERMREGVRAAHDRATREAVGYLERSAAAVRRGSAGAIVEDASGLVAAAFRHRTSRAGDPQLHTHVLVANIGRGPDGRWSALDGRRIYAHARTASFIYQAVLRAELTRALGVEWTPVRGGIAEVVGVPLSVRRAFSRRRADIEAALVERGTSSVRAAEAAALATRRAKDKTIRPDDLVAEWRSHADALGFGLRELALTVGRAPSRDLDPTERERISRHLDGPAGLTRRRATFSRRDVIQALCELLPAGTPIDGQGLEVAVDAFLGSPRVVSLVPAAGDAAMDEGLRRRDGRVMPGSGERVRYSTAEHLALEERLITRVVDARRTGVATVPRAAVERATAARPTLSGEQRDLVERLCLDGDGVAVVSGKAGAGKTFALSAAREAWQAAGHPVLGVAVARRAARELEDGAGIQATSVAALLADLHSGVDRGLPDRSILVVDEAAMVPTRELSALLDHVELARGKLVLVGDHRQLPEIEAGGAFRGLVQRGLAIELQDNLRQIHAWERTALDQLRDGRAGEALALYTAHGCLHVEATEGEARERLVCDWLTSGDPDRSVMIAHRRADVADLNARARAYLNATGELQGPELRLPGGLFAAGDRVVIKTNDLRLGANNGDRGQVVAVDAGAGSLAVRCADRLVVLDRRFLTGATRDGEPTLLHGYAITGHVAQGLTVDQSFVLASEGMTREWAYVALSRGRHSNQLYLADQNDRVRAEFAPTNQEARDPIERLTASLRGSSAQVLAIDTGRPDAEPSDAERLHAQNALARAERELEALDADGTRWLPGAGRLKRARGRAAEARINLAEMDRVSAERRHGARPFLAAQEEDRRVAFDARRPERVLRRERSRGREL